MSRERSPIRLNQKGSNNSMGTMANYQEINLAKEMIPEYSGSSQALSYFISKVEKFITLFKNSTPGQQCCVLNRLFVISKITGAAKDLLIIESPETWEQVKILLIDRFGDTRNKELLQNDLFTCFQFPTENYGTYCVRIKNKLQTLLEHVNLREINRDIRIYKINHFSKIALTTFKTGISEPYRSHLRYINPQTLEACLTALREFDSNKRQSEFLYFMQRSSKYNNNSRNNFKIQENHGSKTSFSFGNNNNKVINNNRNLSTFQSQPSYQNHSFNRFPFNRNTNNHYNNFQSNRNNNNNTLNNLPFGASNNNTINQRTKKNYQPTPISISTRATPPRPVKQNFFQATGPRNFISEELFNLETRNDSSQNDTNNVSIEPSFRIEAWERK